jgi:putative transposase
MAYHTYASLLVHYVFSTKNREPMITESIESRHWAYMGGIARTNSIKALAIGGTKDHAHLLLSLHPSIAVDKAVQLIKSGSSKWMHGHDQHSFAWQIGYGAFTVGISQVNTTIHCIANQKKHHARQSFAAEWQTFLERHGMQEFNRP